MSVVAVGQVSERQDANPSDATLVANALTGDERAFTMLYRRHARYIAGVAYRLLGRDQELDDVVQEAFVDASRALSSLQEPAEFRPWLTRIVVRRVYKRMARRRRFSWLATAVNDLAARVSDPRAREKVDALYEVLDDVGPKLRIPWVLHVIEGQTLPDVAALCDASLATVKRRIAEANALIERRLHGQR